MKYLKKFESKILNYEVGDYIIPVEVPFGANPKDSYSIIDEVRNSSFGDYMISTYNIYTGKQIEHFPVMDYEISRKMTQEEIDNIESLRTAKKYNL